MCVRRERARERGREGGRERERERERETNSSSDKAITQRKKHIRRVYVFCAYPNNERGVRLRGGEGVPDRWECVIHRHAADFILDSLCTERACARESARARDRESARECARARDRESASESERKRERERERDSSLPLPPPSLPVARLSNGGVPAHRGRQHVCLFLFVQLDGRPCVCQHDCVFGEIS